MFNFENNNNSVYKPYYLSIFLEKRVINTLKIISNELIHPFKNPRFICKATYLLPISGRLNIISRIHSVCIQFKR